MTLALRSLVAIALLAGISASAGAAGTTHYVDFVNTAFDSVTSIAVAPSGSDAWHTVALPETTLHGGGESMALAVRTTASDDCLRDLRIAFANGRLLIQKNFDVCRFRSYHTGRYLRGQAQTVIASAP